MDTEADATRLKLKDFFARYEERLNAALAEKPVVDVEATAAAFADCFIEASPLGVSCGKNDDELRAVIPKGYEFYRSIGTKSMNVLSLEATQLDEYHWMAKIHWEALYVKKDGSDLKLEFDVIYFLQALGGALKIFAFIAGDEQKLYREHGLVPG